MQRVETVVTGWWECHFQKGINATLMGNNGCSCHYCRWSSHVGRQKQRTNLWSALRRNAKHAGVQTQYLTTREMEKSWMYTSIKMIHERHGCIFLYICYDYNAAPPQKKIIKSSFTPRAWGERGKFAPLLFLFLVLDRRRVRGGKRLSSP